MGLRAVCVCRTISTAPHHDFQPLGIAGQSNRLFKNRNHAVFVACVLGIHIVQVGFDVADQRGIVIASLFNHHVRLFLIQPVLANFGTGFHNRANYSARQWIVGKCRICWCGFPSTTSSRYLIQGSIDSPVVNQILQLVAKGLTNKDIGRVFGISDNTTRNHVNSIVGKLEVSDRTAAATIAMQQWLVSMTD